MAGRNGVRIGIALGDNGVTGVVLGKKGASASSVSAFLDPDDPEFGVRLLKILQEVRTGLERDIGQSTEGASAFVAFLPPLADARLVDLPPMRKAEAEAVLARDVARYFLGANRPRVVSVRMRKRTAPGSGIEMVGPRPILAAAAPLALLEATRAGLEGVGWDAVSFKAAHACWLQAASEVHGDPIAAIVAVVGTTAHLIRLEGPDPVAVREFPASDLSMVAEAARGASNRAMILASAPPRQETAAALKGRGRTVTGDPSGWEGAEEGAAARAPSPGLEFIPPFLARRRRTRRRKTTSGLMAGAFVLILASFSAQLWGAHRELRAVQERRTSLAAQVTPLLSTRDSLSALLAEIRSLEDLSRSSPVWTRSLVELAALLPADTYLTGFFASGDTLEMEAAGVQAGEAIQALREAGLFQDVRLQGVVEREMEEGETVVERFRLWARLPRRGEEVGGS